MRRLSGSYREKGRNVIPEAEKEPLWKAYLEKFKDPIIIILLVALGLSLGVSGYEMAYSGRDASCLIEPLGVLVAIFLATGIGFIFEVKAEKEFKILNKAKDERPVKVLRLKTGTTYVRRPMRFRKVMSVSEMWWCWRTGTRSRRTAI